MAKQASGKNKGYTQWMNELNQKASRLNRIVLKHKKTWGAYRSGISTDDFLNGAKTQGAR